MSEAENDAAWVAKLIITERDATITALREEVEEANKAAWAMSADVTKATAELTAFRQRVVEVVEPFAAVADAFAEAEDDTFETWRDCHEPAVKEASKLRHFRAARALVNEMETTK